MKIKELTRKLSVGCSQHSFEVADKTDVVCIYFSKSMTKKKTNETRFLSRKLDLIRQNDIIKSGLSIH
ncbi:hypothetical protein [Streptococcus pseudopneumoniae]